jgi:uncharacterized protein YndB with AHSA1/START domain
MARKQWIIEADAHCDAPPEAVWPLLSDVRTWKDWAPFDTSELEHEADGDPNGVGAIRRYTRGKHVTREVVVAYDAPSHFAYELLEGVKVRDYRADVRLERAPEGGTDIRWRSTYYAQAPGTGRIVQIVLGRFIRRTVQGLAAKAGQASRAA